MLSLFEYKKRVISFVSVLMINVGSRAFFLMEWVQFGTSNITSGDCREPEKSRDFLKEIGLGSIPLVCCEQVHGREIALVKDLGAASIPKVDGLLTQVPGVVLGIYTADCVPIFLMDPQNKAVALLHAGWRGVVEQIPVQGVHGLKRNFSSDPKNIRVNLGPHIRDCCFNVGEDLLSQFRKEVVKTEGCGLTISLEEEIISQLVHCGVDLKNIVSSGQCTFHDKNFFSYRRDKTFKRMLSYISIKESYL